jgi:hypothetical protein
LEIFNKLKFSITKKEGNFILKVREISNTGRFKELGGINFKETGKPTTTNIDFNGGIFQSVFGENGEILERNVGFLGDSDAVNNFSTHLVYRNFKEGGALKEIRFASGDPKNNPEAINVYTNHGQLEASYFNNEQIEKITRDENGKIVENRNRNGNGVINKFENGVKTKSFFNGDEKTYSHKIYEENKKIIKEIETPNLNPKTFYEDGEVVSGEVFAFSNFEANKKVEAKYFKKYSELIDFASKQKGIFVGILENNRFQFENGILTSKTEVKLNEEGIVVEEKTQFFSKQKESAFLVQKYDNGKYISGELFTERRPITNSDEYTQNSGNIRLLYKKSEKINDIYGKTEPKGLFAKIKSLFGK